MVPLLHKIIVSPALLIPLLTASPAPEPISEPPNPIAAAPTARKSDVPTSPTVGSSPVLLYDLYASYPSDAREPMKEAPAEIPAWAMGPNPVAATPPETPPTTAEIATCPQSTCPEDL